LCLHYLPQAWVSFDYANIDTKASSNIPASGLSLLRHNPPATLLPSVLPHYGLIWKELTPVSGRSYINSKEGLGSEALFTGAGP